MKNRSEIMQVIFLICLTLVLGGTQLPFADPTQPPRIIYAPQNQKSVGPLQLMAIFISNNRKVAIINNEIVKKGDQIGDFTILFIRSNAVELMGPQNRREILYLVPAIKQNKY